MASTLPASVVSVVRQTIVRLPRCSGSHTATTRSPSLAAAKKFVFDSTVVVWSPGVRFAIVAIPPSMSATDINAPPNAIPPVRASGGVTVNSAVIRSFPTSTTFSPNSLPGPSSSSPFRSICSRTSSKAPPNKRPGRTTGPVLLATGYWLLATRLSPQPRHVYEVPHLVPLRLQVMPVVGVRRRHDRHPLRYLQPVPFEPSALRRVVCDQPYPLQPQVQQDLHPDAVVLPVRDEAQRLVRLHRVQALLLLQLVCL